MSTKEIKKQIEDLIYSGCCEIHQKVGDGPEEEYGGCMHNLEMVLESDEPTFELLEQSDPDAREGVNTYRIVYPGLLVEVTLLIWEV